MRPTISTESKDKPAWLALGIARCGLEPQGFGTAREVLEACRHNAPELVFLDVALQGSDAIDVIRALGEQCFRGAVQLVSGHHRLLEHVKRVGEGYGLRMLAPLHKAFRAGTIEQILNVFCFSSRKALLSYQTPTIQPSNTPMFVAVPPMVSMCRDRAREAHQGAADATDQKIRGFWQEMEHRWLILAEGYETSDIAHAFAHHRRDGRLH